MLPSNSPTPKVSILLPTYNYAQFLPEAIESIRAQSFSDFELIISDDNSLDASHEVIQHYATKDKRIIYIRHPSNLGMVANWNYCLNQARGKYVKYIFGDDCFASPAALALLVNLLEHNPTASIAASARLTIDETTKVDGLWDELSTNGLHEGQRLIKKCLCYNGNLIGEPSALLFKRSLATRGFDPRLKQIVDLEMWLHLLVNADLVYTRIPLCCFRRHGAQQTAVNHEAQAGRTEMVHLLKEYLPILGRNKIQRLGRLARNRILYRAYFILRKKRGTQQDLFTELAWLSAQISPPWRFVCWLFYRLIRPIDNFGHSIRKRYIQLRLSSSAAEQIAFLDTIRKKASRVDASR